MKNLTQLLLVAIVSVAVTLLITIKLPPKDSEEAKVTTMQRLLKLKIKDDCVDEYCQYHRNLWPELEETYKQHGIMQLSCFMDGSSLFVYLECDAEVYPNAKDALAENEIEKKWQAIMATLSDSVFEMVEYKEVYRMD